MIHTRRIWALPALALTLVLAACSTPEDLGAPTLEPQFGSGDDDRGIDVAFMSTGRIYSLSEQFGPTYEEDSDGTSYENGSYEKALLRRYDSSGNVTWTKEVTSEYCGYDYMYDYCAGLTVQSLTTNSQGYVYALTYKGETSYNGYDPTFYDYTVYKYDAAGSLVATVGVGSSVFGPHYNDGPRRDLVEIAVDGSGNIYVAAIDCVAVQAEDGYGTIGGDCTNIVAKYSPSGSLQWQRASTVGSTYDITVSSSGSVYVVGTAGFARYSSSGGLTWTKPGNFEEVVISGSNLYTRYRKDIRKYDGTGKQLWLKPQSGLNVIIFQDMTGDSSGNVYLSGKYDAGGGNFNPMVRKLNSSGTVLWTKTYGTTAYDDARGIATISGSEIYTTGETQGSLAHINIGGRDGYLRKLTSLGNPTWTK